MPSLDKHGGLFVVAAAALAWGAASFARQRCEELRPEIPEQLLNVPPIPAEVMKPFCFGMRAAAADATFLEAIQIFGARRSKTPEAQLRREDTALTRLLDYTTDLDERFTNAYWFAGTALPRHTLDGKAYGVLAAERILSKGVRLDVPDWRLPFLLGFIESYYLGHMADAGAHVALASRMPKAPAYLGLLATRLTADAGELTNAEQMAETMAQNASSDEERETWRARMLDIQMERELRKIEVAARKYKERAGSFPPDPEALVRTGDLPSLPPEPHGGRYQLDPQTGEARSTAAMRLKVRGRSGTQSGMEVH
jgi:hypothetical protein